MNWDFDNTSPDNADGIDVVQRIGGVDTTIHSFTDPATTTFADPNVSNGEDYTYFVRPYKLVNGIKAFGGDSNLCSVGMTGMITTTPIDPILIAPGETASFTMNFSDSDYMATDTATIDWGDGSTGPDDVGGILVNLVYGSHVYTAAGTYTATVTIDNTDGNSTATPITIEVGGIGNAPTNAQAAVTGGDVSVSWNAPTSGTAPTGYTIYGSTDGGTTWNPVGYADGTDSSASLSGLTPSTGYLFYVTATNDFGESAASNTTTAITSPAVPASPTGLTATLNNGNIRLDWTAADTVATGFNIYESTDGGSTFTLFDSVAASSPGQAPPTTYTATGLTAGTTPQFYITAQNASGESAHSSTVSQQLPAPFGGVTTTVDPATGYVTIHWTRDALATGYLISRTSDVSPTTVLIATVTPGTVTSYTDQTADPTAAYRYRVTPFYSTTTPTGVGPSNGGGVSGGGDTDPGDNDPGDNERHKGVTPQSVATSFWGVTPLCRPSSVNASL